MCCCSCLTCCVHCFERFLQFLDKNAYIRIALSGETFCTAAKNAFLMILENAARFAVIGSIGELFNFLGKLLITFASMLLGYLIITKYEYYNDAISSPIPPTVIFGIVSYLVAALFMSVYSMACDSIIVVFIVDERHHKGDNQFAPEPLKEFMAEHRDKEDSGCC